jgi:hypothetical protein
MIISGKIPLNRNTPPGVYRLIINGSNYNNAVFCILNFDVKSMDPNYIYIGYETNVIFNGSNSFGQGMSYNAYITHENGTTMCNATNEIRVDYNTLTATFDVPEFIRSGEWTMNIYSRYYYNTYHTEYKTFPVILIPYYNPVITTIALSSTLTNDNNPIEFTITGDHFLPNSILQCYDMSNTNLEIVQYTITNKTTISGIISIPEEFESEVIFIKILSGENEHQLSSNTYDLPVTLIEEDV